MPIRRLEDTFTGTSATIGADELTSTALASVEHVKPHIQPGTLYPAVAGKLSDGTTSHGATYGVAQADGRMYYYTDIKGSKPIKDPRIGSHFGSQRFQMTSVQTLEQETATHGRNVYTIDGREWMKAVGTITMSNDQYGNYIDMEDDDSPMAFIEVVGYFNDANISLYTTTNLMAQCAVNGGSLGSNLGTSNVDSPLGGRFVHNGSVVNTGITATLGINTLRIEPYDSSGHNTKIHAVELIAQDTTSTATKSQVQIPSQNVVSYGKKFTVSGTPHYDPFAFKTDGSTVWASGAHNGTAWPIGTGSSTNIDTATSLGLAAWLHSSNYYKPYNGGRVVKWIASDGTIKTSVNMMPPNARSIGNSASLTNATAKANASIANNTFYPTMEAGAIDHSLAEVAKTYLPFEFGNGAANGGASGTYLDASMLDGTGGRDIAYVMDDGLTSLSGEDVRRGSNDHIVFTTGTSDFWYLTFIGTGITLGPRQSSVKGSPVTIAQNLPYGTHILKILSDASTHQTTHLYVDGILVHTSSGAAAFEYGGFWNITFHQPKMPPIPDDAVVISDYMLMADFVPQTAAGIEKVSKGTRKVAVSRDVFFTGEAMTVGQSLETDSGWIFYLNSAGTNASSKLRIPSFGTNYVKRGFHDRSTLFIGDSTQSSNQTASTGSAAHGDTHRLTTDQTLGVHNFGSNPNNGANGITSSFEIASPIHTSSHYQTFETPFLHELVGGDRNMEQTNLVVTPDGKTWDEVTRDVSYISKDHKVTVQEDSDHAAGDIVFTTWRGENQATHGLMNKDFAIAYDRMICLVNGTFHLQWNVHASSHAAFGAYIMVNGTNVALNWVDDVSERSAATPACTVQLKRGDYVQCQANSTNIEGSSIVYNNFNITKIA